MIISDKLILNDRDRHILVIMVVIFAVFLTAYFAYSVGKFKQVQQTQLSKATF